MELNGAINPNETFSRGSILLLERDGFAYIMDRIGLNRATFFVFLISSLLNAVWGIEATFVSINLETLANLQHFDGHLFSIFLSIIYMVIAIGSLAVGLSTQYIGRIPCLKISVALYIFCS